MWPGNPRHLRPQCGRFTGSLGFDPIEPSGEAVATFESVLMAFAVCRRGTELSTVHQPLPWVYTIDTVPDKRKHVLKMHPSQGYGKGFGRGDSVRQDGPCDPLLTLYYSGPSIQGVWTLNYLPAVTIP